MGTISKHVAKNGDVTFQAKVRRKGWPTQSKTFHDKKEADKWVRATESALDRGELSKAAKPKADGLNTLADVLRRYAEDISPKKRGGDIEGLTIRRWLRECREFVSMPLAALDAQKVATWRDSQLEGRAGSSVARQMNLLLAAVNLARAEWGCTEIPPIKVARPKSPPHRDRVLTAEEEKRLLNAAGDLRPVIEFAIATAMRQGEIAALKWSDIDWTRKIARLHTSKNGLPRDVPLSTRAIAALECLERGRGPVFGLSAESIKRQFIRLVKRCKITGLRFHDLRHTAITRYARAGLNPIQLSVISGHKDIRMLARYTHLKAEELVGVMG
ncbi:site-specific recombinase XerD [Trinickia symbiotica]|uniref:Site-specific integrase n=1 Tax=Trinickia symbiotica TaxID=863227 RepID=A0A2N7X6A8_9BURK|nr:site-specific integrase [Trinickia symbiotica]PMS37140.1 site-specific integrase [Trinickia symbiotica]PPK42907.1 site-specific recombinase XerD [Trinickia symbiotica]